jgi:hypothetical protein
MDKFLDEIELSSGCLLFSNGEGDLGSADRETCWSSALWFFIELEKASQTCRQAKRANTNTGTERDFIVLRKLKSQE